MFSSVWPFSLALSLHELPNLSLVLHPSHISLVLLSHTDVFLHLTLCLLFPNSYSCFPDFYIFSSLFWSLSIFFFSKRKCLQLFLMYWLIILGLKLVFRYEILNSDVTHKPGVSKTRSHLCKMCGLSLSTFLEDRGVPLILWTTRSFSHVQGLRV